MSATTYEDLFGIKTLIDFVNFVKGGKFDLPNIQRGFVWKPSQIENLWDSLLRGFPIGAIISNEMEGKLQLIDGQQRVTSIALGCIDLQDGKDKVLRSSADDIRIFIDLRKPNRD
ncbi:MAG: DUF262 domain-containing protein, partial [Zoogloeaceae bacterium]|nr:DUF262 domain-containing protein [Zoogloeaceae bacterium]